MTPTLLSAPQIVPGQLQEIGAAKFTLGGCVANTGFDLVSAGVPTKVEALVGDDYLGNIARSLLQERGVDSSKIRTSKESETSWSVIIQPKDIDRTIWHDPGANNFFDPSNLDLTGVDILHIGYPPIMLATLKDDGAPIREIFKKAKDLGITTSLDMAVVDPNSPAAKINWGRFFELTMPLTDVFSPSVEDIFTARLMGRHATHDEVVKTANDFVAQGCGVVCLSNGENGLYFASGSAERLANAGRGFAKTSGAWANQNAWYQPVKPEKFVGTTGAGDATSAGLLYAIANEMGPDGGAKFATAFPSITISGRKTTPENLKAFS